METKMRGKLHGLDLFSGIAGNSIALRDYIDTVAYCEQERYAQYVLLSRMSERLLANRPIWDDVRTLRGDMLPKIDIIVGGFPCQDISVAGRGAGLEGERSGLFFEICRLAQELQPQFLFLENVPAIRTRGASRVIEELSRLGYDCRWTTVSAAEVGAHHKRERWFLLAALPTSSTHRIDYGEKESLAYSSSTGLSVRRQSQFSESTEKSETGLEHESKRRSETVADSLFERPEGQREKSGGIGAQLKDTSGNSWWSVEPDVGRVVNGLPKRVDRIKCLGNAVVPAQAREAFERLIGFKKEAVLYK